MASARPLNYTTTISVTQTVGECQAILAAAGAASVAVHYEGGQPSGLSFTLKTPHGTRAFTLPVDLEAMRRVLAKAEDDGIFAASKKKAGAYSGREHAARVAWRVAKDWLEACLALIAAQMTTIDTVMLPFLVVDGDRTLYQAYQEREAKLALVSGESGERE
jgi:hypothetical protein